VHTSDPLLKSTKQVQPATTRRKVSRVSKACKVCAVSKLKCNEGKPCRRCLQKNIICQYEWRQGSDHEVILPNQQHPGQLGGQQHDIGAQPPLDSSEFLGSTISSTERIQRSPPYNENVASISIANLDTPDTACAVIVPNLTAQTHSTGGTDESESLLSYDTPVVDAYGVEPSMAETTIYYTNFLKDLVNGPQSDDRLGLPVRNDRTVNDIWDLHMDNDEDLDIFSDFSIQQFPNSVFETLSPGLRTPGARQDNVGWYQSSSEDVTVAAGARAFEKSGWNWSPKPQDHGSAEEHNLSLPADWTSPSINVSSDPSLSFHRLDSKSRARILSVVFANCENKNLVGILSSFPAVPVLDGMLQLFLRSQTYETLSWVHVPTFKQAIVRDELLAAMVGYGACLTSIEIVQKLGYAMLDVLLFTTAHQVCFLV
jgi:Fungal Zn(2)-Cys(6) binuclear cluster domain